MKASSKSIIWLSMGSLMAERGYCARIMDEKKNVATVLPEYKHYLISFESLRSYKHRARFIKKYKSDFVLIYAFPSLPNRNLIFLALNLFFYGLVTALFLWRLKAEYIYAQGGRAAFIALMQPFLSNHKVVLDVHGMYVEELHMIGIHKPHTLFSIFDRYVEKTALLNAGKLVVVSHVMQEYIMKRYGRKTDIYIIPCCYDDAIFSFSEKERNRFRRELGIANETVFVYSGSFAVWQQIPKMLSVFKQYRIHDPAAIFLVLSQDDRSTLDRYTAELSIPKKSVLYLSLPRKDVYKYLSAADVALLFREHNIVNLVSSPTKFGEYLACGLPVVISEHVGDYSEVCRHEGLGTVLGDEQAIMNIHEFIPSLLSRKIKLDCVIYAKKNLSWNTVRSTYRDIFAP